MSRPLSSVSALGGATLSQCARDPATLIAVGLLGLGTLTLHATTVFGFEAEAAIRAEMVRDSLLLGGMAAVALGLVRVGGVEWRDQTVAPLLATPLGRPGWFAGRALGLALSGAGTVVLLTLAAATMAAFGARAWTAWPGLVACVALLTAATLKSARPRSAAVPVALVLSVAGGAVVVIGAGSALWLTAAGAALAAAVLAVVGLTASMWFPLGGALGMVVGCYLLGHTAAPGFAGAFAGRVVWRCVVPDLAAVAALHLGAVVAAAAWTGGVGWIGAERARARDL